MDISLQKDDFSSKSRQPRFSFLTNIAPLLRGHDRIAGLVVEQERVRFAEFRTASVSTVQKHRILVEEGATRLTAGTIRAGMLAQPINLREAIQELRTKGSPHNLSAQGVVASVPIAHLVGRTISLPLSVRSSEFEQALRLEMERLLPFPIDEAYFDWQEIPASSEGASVRQFLVMAAKKDEIDPYLAALQGAGLNVIALEPITMSIVRGIEGRTGITYIALVYPENLLAAAMDGQGRPRFFHHRSLPKLPEASSSQRWSKERTGALVSELISFIRFFRTEVGGTEQELIADGPLDDNSLNDLQVLSQALNLKIRIEEDSHALSRAAARGAALRGIMFRSEDRLISLMPLGTEQAYTLRRREFFVKSAIRTLVAAGVISVVLLVGAMGYLRNIEMSAHDHGRGQVPIPEELVHKVDAVNADIKRASDAAALPKVPERLPKALSEAVPPGVKILNIIIDAQQAGSTRVEHTVLASNLRGLQEERDILQKDFSSENLALPKELALKPNEGVNYTFIFTLKSDFK